MRVLAIIHLCIVFTLISWYAGYPFMGEHFHIKAKKKVFETVMGKDNEPNHTKFEQLPTETQKKLAAFYKTLSNHSQKPFLIKIKDGLVILAFKLSPFERAWILFSVIIPILILLRKDGANQAVIVLPLLALAFCFDNQLNGKTAPITHEIKLFPTEEHLIDRYLDEPFSSNISSQKNQLTKSFNRYLVNQWGDTLEAAIFSFNTKRAEAIVKDSNHSFNIFQKKEPFFLLFLYLIWNSFFAFYTITKNPTKKISLQKS